MNFLKLQLKPQQPHHRSYCRSYNPLALPLIVITLPLLHRACCMYWSRVVVVVVVEGNSCSSSCGSRHRHPQQLLLLLPHRLSLHSLPPHWPRHRILYCITAFQPLSKTWPISNTHAVHALLLYKYELITNINAVIEQACCSEVSWHHR